MVQEPEVEIILDKPLSGVNVRVNVVTTHMFWLREKCGLLLLRLSAWVLGVDDIELESSDLIIGKAKEPKAKRLP